ncbi:hypothetical protein AXX04_30755 [Pseudomonas aeruginosa]|uniref:ATP-binding protein n=1 Tax=Pseudomonas aeruginosa group TaxID=136841 RepID=UPI000EE3C22B|nr:ATP-binding protein [Pseudomonas aeruginosa]MCR3762547.1 ATP-binding protein [Pseudomonas aeruginosa]RIZ44546.1 hypothetical protein AXX04_30755 [Pseudomonas aeruginosa]HCF2415329.1 ATP-binding protein [Pseudomonas aeruginosa]
MSKLVRIVLIDSLCRGTKADLCLDGNTAIMGTNGIGKTSFMRLIPIFYGIKPGELIAADSNKKSFADWYLPNPTSFIVFEYLNWESHPRCVVMHRSSDTYAYRFVKSGWRNELIYEDIEAGRMVMSSDLQRHMSKQGVDCTAQIPPLYYGRTILFNTDSNNLEGIEGVDKRNLVRTMRSAFSLAPRGKHLSGLDRLTVALIESKGTFDSMKSTMASILDQDSVNPAEMLKTFSVQSFKEILDSRDGYLALEELGRAIVDLDTTRHEFEACIAEMGKLRSWAALLNDEREAESRLINDEASVLTNKESEFNEQASDLRSKAGLKVSETSVAATTAEQSLKMVEEKQEGFQQHGIDELRVLHQRFEGMCSSVSEKRQLLNNIEREGADLRRFAEIRIQQIKDDFVREKESLEANYKTAVDDFECRSVEINTQREQGNDDCQARERAETQALTQNVTRLKVRCGQLRSEYAQLGRMKVSPENQIAIDEANTTIRGLNASLNETNDLIVQCQGDTRKIQEGLDDCARGAQNIANNRNEIVRLQEELKRQCEPGRDSFLGFLRHCPEGSPDWVSTISKVVPAEILLRTDLSPRLSGAGGSSLYGYEIDLERLDDGLIANLEQMRMQIAELAIQLDDLDQEQARIQKEADQLSGKLKHQKQVSEQLSRKWSECDANLRTQISAHEALCERAEAEHRESLERLNAELIEVTALAEEAAQALKLVEAAFGQERMAIKNEANLHMEALEAEKKSYKQSYDKQVDGFRREEKHQIEAVHAALEKDLASKGINNLQRNQLLSEIGDLDQKIRRCNESRSLIESYELFLAHDLPRLPQLGLELSKKQAALEQAEREKARLEQELEVQRKLYSKERKLLKDRWEVVSQDQQRLAKVIGRLSSVAANTSEPIPKGMSVAQLEYQASQLALNRKRLADTGRELLRTIHDRFVRGPVRSLAHTHQGAKVSRIYSQATADADDEYQAWVYAAPPLLDLLNSQPDHKRLLIMQIHNLSTELENSRGQLKDLHKTILKLGKRATDKAGETLGAFPAIRNFEFHVSSRIHALDFWDELDTYVREFARWKALGADVLPAASFIAAMKQVEQKLTDGAFGATLSNCFDVSVRVDDQGSHKVATTNNQLVGISSQGLSRIIVYMIYVSLFELLRDTADFEMSIPFDEALEIAPENVISLVSYFNNRHIRMLAGFPGGAPELLRRFQHCYTLRRHKERVIVTQYLPPRTNPLQVLNYEIGESQEAGVCA